MEMSFECSQDKMRIIENFFFLLSFDALDRRLLKNFEIALVVHFFFFNHIFRYFDVDTIQLFFELFYFKLFSFYLFDRTSSLSFKKSWRVSWVEAIVVKYLCVSSTYIVSISAAKV
jgi:hypothetical protein